MDFFARQESARRRTGWLVVLFFAALAGIIATAYVAVTAILQVALSDVGTNYEAYAQAAVPRRFDPEILLGVSSFISLVVLGGTAFKLSQLKQGGEKVAEMLGGQQINPASRQFHERRLLNVVEEMALASGVPVPPVYVMVGQHGINAFAAGYSINDAVIGVTEGTLRGLKRSELQGVIAHEFSHILNGDMRLNIRLIGILHGLLILAIIGRGLLRVTGSSRRSSSNKKGGGVLLVVALGLALMIIGYFGYFFGGLIKRAVSRQREYLADASAVQFTRDPDGLAGALKKIGGLAAGGSVNHAKAEELSHMFFTDGIRRFFGSGSLFSTHPPLIKRIQLLDPGFDGEFPIITSDTLYLSARDEEESAQKDAKRAEKEKRDQFIKGGALAGTAVAGGAAGGILQQVGMMEAAAAGQATSPLDAIPEALRETARDPIGAQSIVYAALISRTDGDSADAWTWIPAAFIDAVGRCHEQMKELDSGKQLMVIELSIPALRTLNEEQAERFLEVMREIIDSDKQLDLFEFAVNEIVVAGLRRTLGLPVPRIKRNSFREIADEASILLSMLACVGADNLSNAETAFLAAMESAGEEGKGMTFKSKETFDADAVRQALESLLTAAMPVRKTLLQAALACLHHDRTATPQEIELFRTFAAALEIPVPPGVVG